MAYTDPATHVWTTGELVSAANLKAQTSDNIDALNKRLNHTAAVATSQTTASTTFADLATVGPTLSSLTTGTFALAIVSCTASSNTANAIEFMSVDVSGATTIPASAFNPLTLSHATIGGQEGTSRIIPIVLNAGTNSFKAKYAVNAGTGTFSGRELTMILQL